MGQGAYNFKGGRGQWWRLYTWFVYKCQPDRWFSKVLLFNFPSKFSVHSPLETIWLRNTLPLTNVYKISSIPTRYRIDESMANMNNMIQMKKGDLAELSLIFNTRSHWQPFLYLWQKTSLISSNLCIVLFQTGEWWDCFNSNCRTILPGSISSGVLPGE